MTNNEAETYALFEGIRLAFSIGVQKITIRGDSMMVIRVIVHKNIVEGNIYFGVISRILALLKNFEEYSFFHIKRELNSDVDQKDKEGPNLRKGEIKVNGSIKLLPIP